MQYDQRRRAIGPSTRDDYAWHTRRDVRYIFPPMTDHTRALVARAVANLRHAYTQPNLDRGIADNLIAPEIRRLESVLDGIDLHHRRVSTLVDKAAEARADVDGKLHHAERTLIRVLKILGPQPPTDGPCAGCVAEITAAIEAIREYGILHDPYKDDR